MEQAKADFINPKDPSRGISLTYNTDIPCQGSTYSFKVDIRCDEGARHPVPRLASQTVE